jgi:hypothetical protein
VRPIQDFNGQYSIFQLQDERLHHSVVYGSRSTIRQGGLKGYCWNDDSIYGRQIGSKSYSACRIGRMCPIRFSYERNTAHWLDTWAANEWCETNWYVCPCVVFFFLGGGVDLYVVSALNQWKQSMEVVVEALAPRFLAAKQCHRETYASIT